MREQRPPRPPLVPAAPRPRVILLGASNLTRGLSLAVETARVHQGEPIDVLAALGHGRSFGVRSRVLARSLPSILECGLWPALSGRAARPPTYALITDVGNDLAYGADPARISGWVAECARRLTDAGARIALTALPVESLRGLSKWRFEIIRRMLFPTRPLVYETLIDHAVETDERLRELARREGHELIEVNPSWYGIDAIHIRRRVAAEAWARILTPGTGDRGPAVPVRGSLRRWLRLRRARPERRWVLGREQRGPQPAVRRPDGGTVSLY